MTTEQRLMMRQIDPVDEYINMLEDAGELESFIREILKGKFPPVELVQKDIEYFEGYVERLEFNSHEKDAILDMIASFKTLKSQLEKIENKKVVDKS